jgi:hypothetical protein
MLIRPAKSPTHPAPKVTPGSHPPPYTTSPLIRSAQTPTANPTKGPKT